MNIRPLSSALRPEILKRGVLICLLLTAACLNAAQWKEARITHVVNDVKLLSPQDSPHPAAAATDFTMAILFTPARNHAAN